MKFHTLCLLAVAAVIALTLVLEQPSDAANPRTKGPLLGQGGYAGYGFGQQYGLGYYGLGGPFEMSYAMGRIPTPPYFALHPPVYYSYPVPRSYGYSPFAYPGTVKTPDVIPLPPEEVINPHVEGEGNSAAEADDVNHVAQIPFVLHNPYVHLDGKESLAKLAQATQK